VQCKQIILSYIGMHAQSQRPFQRGAIGEDTAAADILAGRVEPMSIEGMHCTFRTVGLQMFLSSQETNTIY
jgi:hypothetical protein